MIRFLAELAKRERYVYPTPIGCIGSGSLNVYVLDTGKPPASSYWTDWGGYYDNVYGSRIELYYTRYLDRADSLNDVTETPYSLYTEKSNVYFTIPSHPWLYPDHEISCDNVMKFLSAPLNPDDPANNIIENEHVPVRLEVPDFSVKLSDNIAGVTLRQEFSVTLINNDGYFDDSIEWNIFNTPLYVKKTIKDNPCITDFKTIRNGLVDNISTAFNGIIINVSDTLRTLDDPACQAITQDMFLGLDINEQALGKQIPLVYGTKKHDILEISEGIYCSAENASSVSDVQTNDNINLPFVFDDKTGLIRLDYSAITGVFDKDDEPVGFTYIDGGLQTEPAQTDPETRYPGISYITDEEGNMYPYKYDSGAGIITFEKARHAIITGNENNKIGEIIQDLFSKKTKMSITGTYFNLIELYEYTEYSAPINIAITGGDIKKAIQDVLKNDMAFLIQQTDGKFTVRKYGNNYTSHKIPAWAITKKPEKNWNTAQERYFSSCIINYDYEDKNIYKSYLYNENEAEAEDAYRKKARREFATELVSKTAAHDLAVLLSKRYTFLKETLKLSVGTDTSDYELLDTVIIDADINKRKFSNVAAYFIKEINHAQDILTLEEI